MHEGLIKQWYETLTGRVGSNDTFAIAVHASDQQPIITLTADGHQEGRHGLSRLPVLRLIVYR
jgi:hypothetical protein